MDGSKMGKTGGNYMGLSSDLFNSPAMCIAHNEIYTTKALHRKAFLSLPLFKFPKTRHTMNMVYHVMYMGQG